MNITINGNVYITNYGKTLDELTEGIEFDLFDKDDFDCYDNCEFCDCDDDEFLDPIEKLVEEYVEVLSDECICPDCIRGVLTNFVFDLINGE